MRTCGQVPVTTTRYLTPLSTNSPMESTLSVRPLPALELKEPIKVKRAQVSERQETTPKQQVSFQNDIQKIDSAVNFNRKNDKRPPTALDVKDDRIPCPHCSRKFLEESFERHVNACAKLKSKKRPVFNAQAKRIKGTEIEKFFCKSPTEVKKKPKPTRSRIGVVETDDYISCPYCLRRFNRDSGERHINFCKESHERNAMAAKAASQPPSNAEILFQKRKQYCPPRLKKLSTFCPGCGCKQTPGAKFCCSCGAIQ